jgi:Cas3 C-terminal domain
MPGDDWLPHQDAVAVVIVHRDPASGTVTAAAGGPALDLGSAAPAAPEVIERLRESLVRIDAAEDVPGAVVDALRAQPAPVLFRQSVWLRDARVLILELGETGIAGCRIGYRPGVGLWAGEPADPPPRE